jgi:hypothetical protein
MTKLLHSSSISLTLNFRKFSSATKQVISYVTDLEGEYDYWMKFVENSQVLQLRNNERKGNQFIVTMTRTSLVIIFPILPLIALN